MKSVSPTRTKLGSPAPQHSQGSSKYTIGAGFPCQRSRSGFPSSSAVSRVSPQPEPVHLNHGPSGFLDRAANTLLQTPPAWE